MTRVLVRSVAALIVACAVSLASPASASTASVLVSSNKLIVEASFSPAIDLTIRPVTVREDTFDIPYFRVHNSLSMLSASTGCKQIDANTVDCQRNPGAPSDITGYQVEGSPEGDRIDLSALDITGSVAGNDGDDHLMGGQSNEIFYPGRGKDVVSGGPGLDDASYRFSAAGVTVTLDGVANDGPAGEADNIKTSIENVWGSSHDDKLVGSGTSNQLMGGDGDDVLDGGYGDDLIYGGDGLDTASYKSHDTAVTVTLGLAPGTAAGGSVGESDYIQSDVENLRGGSGNDWLTGSAGRNLLKGAGGNDFLRGDQGSTPDLKADSYSGGAGVDTVTYADRGSSVDVSLNNLADDGDQSQHEADNVTASIENVIGGSGDDHLVGSDANNVLKGRGGSDRVNGRGGTDRCVAEVRTNCES